MEILNRNDIYLIYFITRRLSKNDQNQQPISPNLFLKFDHPPQHHLSIFHRYYCRSAPGFRCVPILGRRTAALVLRFLRALSLIARLLLFFNIAPDYPQLRRTRMPASIADSELIRVVLTPSAAECCSLVRLASALRRSRTDNCTRSHEVYPVICVSGLRGP
jgi:hypothetical protein